MIDILCLRWTDLIIAALVVAGTILTVFGYESVEETEGFDTTRPFQRSWRLWLGLVLILIAVAMLVVRTFSGGCLPVGA